MNNLNNFCSSPAYWSECSNPVEPDWPDPDPDPLQLQLNYPDFPPL